MLMAIGAPAPALSKNVRFSAFRSWSWTCMKLCKAGGDGNERLQVLTDDSPWCTDWKAVMHKGRCFVCTRGRWAWLCAYGWMCVCVHAGVSTCKHALTCFRSSGLFSALSKWACHSPRVPALEQSEVATPRLAWSGLMACLLDWFDVSFFFSLSFLPSTLPGWLT